MKQFYGRTPELETLSRWLTTQNTPLISVLGLSGIGKTSLVKKWVDVNSQNFEVVVWKDLKISQSLEQAIAEILTLVQNTKTENQLTHFFNLLRQKRCLIILDNVEELFDPRKFAGQYRKETQDYQMLFSKIPEIEHQSSFILISCEQCQEMLSLDEELYPIKSLALGRLDNHEILKNQKLTDESSWLKLIELYESNPTYLKDIARIIRNIFGGKVAEFLREERVILTERMKSEFTQLYDRLLPQEQEIVRELSQFPQSRSRDELRKNLQLSSMDLINGLQSLQQRYLVKRIAGEQVLFDLSPVFREYIREKINHL
ncbi:MAG: NB-ARC domain-containing protein [Spirulina sp.]